MRILKMAALLLALQLLTLFLIRVEGMVCYRTGATSLRASVAGWELFSWEDGPNYYASLLDDKAKGDNGISVDAFQSAFSVSPFVNALFPKKEFGVYGDIALMSAWLPSVPSVRATAIARAYAERLNTQGADAAHAFLLAEWEAAPKVPE